MDEFAEKYWSELNVTDKQSLLYENDFWDGLTDYKYIYLPSDLKEVIYLIINKK